MVIPFGVFGHSTGQWSVQVLVQPEEALLSQVHDAEKHGKLENTTCAAGAGVAVAVGVERLENMPAVVAVAAELVASVHVPEHVAVVADMLLVAAS